MTGVISGVIRLVVAVTYGDRLNEGLLAAVGARGLVGAIWSVPEAVACDAGWYFHHVIE